MDNDPGKIMSTSFDLLLGRRTYEIFAAHWPYQNDAIGEIFNRINNMWSLQHPLICRGKIRS
jgi:dihydrofolate reductase